jgi:nucleotide-binding universal stress UspA family protein
MDTKTLANRVRALLDAEARLEAQRDIGADAAVEAGEAASLRETVLQAVLGGEAEVSTAVANAIRDYVSAGVKLDECRVAGRDTDFASRHREEARHVLEGHLLAIVSGGREERPAGEGRKTRVLVAIDNSAPSDWAVDVGTRFCQDLDGEMRLVHVIPLEAGMTEDFVTAQKFEAMHRKESAELLEQVARSLPASVNVSRSLREGPAAKEVLAAAAEWDADFIVMGTRGKGRIAHLLLGSTAEAVVRESRCPVVTVGHAPTARVAKEREPVVAALKI